MLVACASSNVVLRLHSAVYVWHSRSTVPLHGTTWNSVVESHAGVQTWHSRSVNAVHGLASNSTPSLHCSVHFKQIRSLALVDVHGFSGSSYVSAAQSVQVSHCRSDAPLQAVSSNWPTTQSSAHVLHSLSLVVLHGLLSNSDPPSLSHTSHSSHSRSVAVVHDTASKLSPGQFRCTAGIEGREQERALTLWPIQTRTFLCNLCNSGPCHPHRCQS